MIIPIFIIGLISSIVTEFFKLFPALRKSDQRKRAVAFIIAFLIALAWLITQPGILSELGVLGLITGSIAASFAIYKSVIQPIEGVFVKSKREEEIQTPEPPVESDEGGSEPPTPQPA